MITGRGRSDGNGWRRRICRRDNGSKGALGPLQLYRHRGGYVSRPGCSVLLRNFTITKEYGLSCLRCVPALIRPRFQVDSKRPRDIRRPKAWKSGRLDTDHCWHLYFDTNEAVKRVAKEAGWPAPTPTRIMKTRPARGQPVVRGRQTGTTVVPFQRCRTKLVLQSCTLGCLSRLSMMKRE